MPQLSFKQATATVLAAIALGVLIAAMSVGTASSAAGDSLTPSPVNVTLQAGQSTTVNKTLHLDGLPAKADIIVAIDTTGSMGAALAKAKTDAVDICNDVKAAIPGARFAAVEFQDYPFSPYGVASDDPYELHTAGGYTANCATFSAGVAAMALGNGLDGPESNNRVHFEAYSDSVLLASRDSEATRFLVVLADNVPHSTAAFGACPSTGAFSDPGRNGTNESGFGDDIETAAAIAGLNADNHTLLYISYISGTSTHPCHEALAAATGGDAVPDEDAADIGAFIIAQAEDTPYSVDLQVSAGCPIGFSFAPSFPQGPLSGEQTIPFTETITAPTISGNYTCTITAVMTPGGPTTAVETVNVLVYELAPGGGAFVIGDKSATGPVTFWGAQWWKLNVLSGGAAPAAFKGFALNPAVPVCGTGWSTDPGNSAPPPAGPLPAYMAVIVTSTVTKSGSQISGDTARIVVVKTNAGYAANPGHAGTGTVVASVC